jgi:hypothetical protein
MSARVTLIAMVVSGSLILVDQTAVPLATPHIIKDLGGSVSDRQWVLGHAAAAGSSRTSTADPSRSRKRSVRPRVT